VRLFVFFSLLSLGSRALAQDAGTPQVAPVAEEEIHIREPGSQFTWTPPPEVGACIGGSCAPPPGVVPRAAVFGQPVPSPVQRGERERDPRMRFAYTGAVLGAVSAALVLGSAIAIAQVDDNRSERITRGVWVGYLGVSTTLVALSAHLASGPGGASGAGKATRQLGWTAFALAFTDGLILWAGAWHEFGDLDVLTIGAGAIGVVALLPHALDALVAARDMKVRRLALQPTANGLRLRF
jgi:hypothetical protein